MISEERWENDEISFQNVHGHREPVNVRIKGMFITYCVCDFLFNGYPCMKKKINVMLYCREKYGIRPTDEGHTHFK